MKASGLDNYNLTTLYFIKFEPSLINTFVQAPFNEVTYELIGDDDGPDYFQIDDKSGKISVKKDLRAENVDFYNVSGMVP